MARAAQNKAVERRTQERLEARREAAQRGVETRRRKREAREQAPVAPQAPEPQEQQAQAAHGQTRRPQRTVAQAGRARPGGQAAGPMVTVARAPRGVRCESPNALVTR
jgi:hypothetical protein